MQDFTRNSTSMAEKRLLLNKLPVPQDSYDDYFRCIAAVHRAGFSDQEVEAWAATGAKYTPGEWTEIRAHGIDRYDGEPITEATFFWFCEQAGIFTSGDGGVQPPAETPDPWHFRPVTSAELLALPETAWIIQDILPIDTLALLAGPPKAGKSAVLTAWALSQDSTWLGKWVNKARWLHFTEETPRSILNRYRAAGHDLHYDTDAYRMLACVRTWRRHWTFDGFINEVAERILASDANPDVANFDVLVLDTLLFWLEISDANDASDVTQNLRSVQQLKDALPGKTVLLVHQTGKGAMEGNAGNAIMGSTAFRATFGVNLVITRQASNMTLHVEGRDVDDETEIAYVRDRDPDNGKIIWTPRSDIDDVLTLLLDDPDRAFTVKDIESEIASPMTDAKLRKALAQLVTDRHVKRSKAGKAYTWQAVATQ